MKRLAVLLLCVCPLFATMVTGPVKAPNTVRPFTGTIKIVPSRHWVNISGEEISPLQVILRVTAGNITAVDGVAATSVDLEPNDTAQPANTYYTFYFQGPANSYVASYGIPTSATPLTIPQLTPVGDTAPALVSVAGGDLYGSFPNPNVGRLRGLAICTTIPSDAQVFTWSASLGCITWGAGGGGGGGTPSAHATSHGLGGSDPVNLDASQIVTGSLGVGLIPGLPGSILTSGTIPSARLSLLTTDIPTLGTAKIGSGIFPQARGGTGADLSGSSGVITTTGGLASATQDPSVSGSLNVSGTGPGVYEFGDENGLLGPSVKLPSGTGKTTAWVGATGRTTCIGFQMPTSDPSGNNRVPIWGTPVADTYGCYQAPFAGWANVAARNTANAYSGSGLQDYSQVPTRPFQSDVVANIPATCSVGQFYYATDTGRPYTCTAANTWQANIVARNGANAYSGSGLQDFSQVATRPFQADVVANIPATCSVGQKFYASDTGRDYTCSATNTWQPASTPNATGTGLVARTGTNSASNRTIAVTGRVSCSNCDGVSGNPTVALAESCIDTSVTANAITCTFTLGGSLADGMVMSVKPAVDSTGATTISLNAGTAVPVTLQDASTISTELRAGRFYPVVWDATASRWRLISPTLTTTGSGSSVLATGPTFTGVGNTALYAFSAGGDIDSTGTNITIAPTKMIQRVTGTGSIQTITAPSAFSSFSGCINLIPTGAWTMATGGNIARAVTAVAGKVLTICYLTATTTWYPSY